MNSLGIAIIKKSITDYLDREDVCAEVKRMIVKEVYEEVSKKAAEEINSEIAVCEKEDKRDGKTGRS